MSEAVDQRSLCKPYSAWDLPEPVFHTISSSALTRVNASPRAAGSAHQAPPSSSVDTASENKCWANRRMGRAWAPPPLELLSSTGAGVGEKQQVIPLTTCVGGKL